MKKTLLATVLLVLSITSCQITKRVHRKGFHVQWHKLLQDKNKYSGTVAANQLHEQQHSSIIDPVEREVSSNFLAKADSEVISVDQQKAQKLENERINLASEVPEKKVYPVKSVAEQNFGGKEKLMQTKPEKKGSTLTTSIIFFVLMTLFLILGIHLYYAATTSLIFGAFLLLIPAGAALIISAISLIFAFLFLSIHLVEKKSNSEESNNHEETIKDQGEIKNSEKDPDEVRQDKLKDTIFVVSLMTAFIGIYYLIRK